MINDPVNLLCVPAAKPYEAEYSSNARGGVVSLSFSAQDSSAFISLSVPTVDSHHEP